MELAIFSKTYKGNAEEIFQKMNNQKLNYCHFNLANIGMDMIPDYIDYDKLNNLNVLLKKYNIKLIGLSGTFNMIDCDKENKEKNICNFENLCKIANILHVKTISLCTGSKNKNSKWEWDDENETNESYNEFLETMKRLLVYAHKYDIILSIEPEASNVINSARKARNVLDHFKDEHIKIIMDAANLLNMNNYNDQDTVIIEAFDLIGNDIIEAHAKNFNISDNKIKFVAPFNGKLNYELVIKLLNKYNYKGTFVMHALEENEVDKSIKYLKENFDALY